MSNSFLKKNINYGLINMEFKLEISPLYLFLLVRINHMRIGTVESEFNFKNLKRGRKCKQCLVLFLKKLYKINNFILF